MTENLKSEGGDRDAMRNVVSLLIFILIDLTASVALSYDG